MLAIADDPNPPAHPHEHDALARRAVTVVIWQYPAEHQTRTSERRGIVHRDGLVSRERHRELLQW
jgi:hypothetical protein